jgi:hypothetical protein
VDNHKELWILGVFIRQFAIVGSMTIAKGLKEMLKNAGKNSETVGNQQDCISEAIVDF